MEKETDISASRRYSGIVAKSGFCCDAGGGVSRWMPRSRDAGAKKEALLDHRLAQILLQLSPTESETLHLLLST